MKATHQVINTKHNTYWNIGSKIVFLSGAGVNEKGDALFTDTTGVVAIGANLAELKEI